MDEQGPYDSLEEALDAARSDFSSADGGFWETIEQAEKHADWMREQGYNVE